MNQDIITLIIVSVCALMVLVGLFRFIFGKKRRGACRCGGSSAAGSSAVCDGCVLKPGEDSVDVDKDDGENACESYSKPFSDGAGLGI